MFVVVLSIEAVDLIRGHGWARHVRYAAALVIFCTHGMSSCFETRAPPAGASGASSVYQCLIDDGEVPPLQARELRLPFSDGVITAQNDRHHPVVIRICICSRRMACWRSRGSFDAVVMTHHSAATAGAVSASSTFKTRPGPARVMKRLIC